jgi:hypothetical protein
MCEIYSFQIKKVKERRETWLFPGPISRGFTIFKFFIRISSFFFYNDGFRGAFTAKKAALIAAYN